MSSPSPPAPPAKGRIPSRPLVWPKAGKTDTDKAHRQNNIEKSIFLIKNNSFCEDKFLYPIPVQYHSILTYSIQLLAVFINHLVILNKIQRIININSDTRTASTAAATKTHTHRGNGPTGLRVALLLFWYWCREFLTGGAEYPQEGQPEAKRFSSPENPHLGQRTDEKNLQQPRQAFRFRLTSVPQLSQKNFGSFIKN